MYWTGRVARMVEMGNAHSSLVGNPEVNRILGRPRRSWKILLGWILGKECGKLWTGFMWPRIRTGGVL
jgi:hypothetical protein